MKDFESIVGSGKYYCFKNSFGASEIVYPKFTAIFFTGVKQPDFKLASSVNLETKLRINSVTHPKCNEHTQRSDIIVLPRT